MTENQTDELGDILDNQTGRPTAIGLRSAARSIILGDGDTQRANRLVGPALARRLAANYLHFKGQVLAAGPTSGYGPERELLKLCSDTNLCATATVLLIDQALQLHTGEEEG